MEKIVEVIAKKIFIDSLPAGYTTIARARETFCSYIDPDFKNLDLDEEQRASEKTEVDVYELKKNANFFQMFTSLNNDLNKLCLTQDQIVNFCKNHSKHFVQNGGGTFFLSKKKNQSKNYFFKFLDYFFKIFSRKNSEFFVVRAIARSCGLGVDIICFEFVYIWRAEDSYRLVVPVSI